MPPTTSWGASRISNHDDAARAARDRLLRSIAADTDLPSMGSSVARVVQLASSDDDSVRELANFLLSDVALTQKVLRLSNTVTYRTASGVPVTTISRAIFLLGFETVKTSALAMLLVDGMHGKQAEGVRTELGAALCASVIGREMARRSPFKDAEEAAIVALFKNMGRLLVAAHDHRLYTDISRLCEQQGLSPTQASTQVLGCSFDMLAESVLQEWQIPDTIIHALAPLPPGTLKPARQRSEWLQQVAAFSTAVATLTPKMTEPGQDAASRAVLSRFGAALNLDGPRLSELLATVALETRALTENAGLLWGAEPPPANAADAAAADPAAAAGAADLPPELLMLTGEVVPVAGCHPSGKPYNAQALLLAGVQDLAEMLATGRSKPNDLILLALETLHRSMGFRFAAVCLKDGRSGQYRARLGVGADSARLQQGFTFAASGPRDVFRLAMDNDADLVIADAGSATIAALIPSWHAALMPEVRSFIILPLLVHKAPFGFFYADRTMLAPEGIPADETALIRTLKGQVLAALNAR